MRLLKLALRNLLYYKKANLAILAGTMISAAVLTGALVVGDSVRHSLDALTDIRLGKTRLAIHSADRLFRQDLAKELSSKTKTPLAAVLQVEGMALNTVNNAQMNRVLVLGVDQDFASFWPSPCIMPAENEVVISKNVAEKLGLTAGDALLLKLPGLSKAPQNAPFVSEKEDLVVFQLKVSAIADDDKMGRFSLNSNQLAPYNVFISLSSMATRLGVSGFANQLLFAGNPDSELDAKNIDSLLAGCWQPADAGLEFRALSMPNSYEIRSDRIFVDDVTARHIQTCIPEAKPVLTYLVNAISTSQRATPYSFVTAANMNVTNQTSGKSDIIICHWLANDLGVKAGDSLWLRYFKMGPLRSLSEDSSRFIISKVLPISDRLFDSSLMPDFPGMSAAGNCRDWETGAPVDFKKIRDKDEQFWNVYKGTPKAFISYEAGKEIWNNAFGHVTAFRFEADTAQLHAYKHSIIKQLKPADNGLILREIYKEGKISAANSTDFGGLFLSLSFFIIVAAMLLTALLLSLHAENRMTETAVYVALGFRKQLIIKILFLELTLLVVIGSALGALAGIAYHKLMLLGLNTLWQDAVSTTILQTQLQPATLSLGFAINVITALGLLLFVLQKNLSKLLSVNTKGRSLTLLPKKHRWHFFSLTIALLCFFSAVLIVIQSVLSKQADSAESFLMAGGLMLTAAVFLLNFLLKPAIRPAMLKNHGFVFLVLKNLRMKRHRTLTAIALLAIGTFSVIITGANRKTFYGTEKSHQSGTGGFLFWAETTVPIRYDLNTTQGKEKFNMGDEEALQKTHFVQLLQLKGNDASCLNLNRVAQAGILGVNAAYFDKIQAFRFLSLDPSVNAQHPWLALDSSLSAGLIPAYADQTVIQWGLGKKIGDTLLYHDEGGKVLMLKIIGGLDNSVFQGHVLISARLFSHYFPGNAGSSVMLMEGDFSKRTAISDRMEYLFQDYGIVLTPASVRLAQFNAVENTYLTVFMMLGGLGLMIGTIGLGIVMLRNLAERKQEIALYQAIGFNNTLIFKLIFVENVFILLAGLGIGILAASVGIIPSLTSASFQLPGLLILEIVTLILINGILWIVIPASLVLRKSK